MEQELESFPVIKKEAFDNLSKRQRENWILDTAECLQRLGFPIYKFSHQERLDKFFDLKRVDSKTVLKTKDGIPFVSQNFTGLTLAWHYFPYHWGVPITRKKSPVEAFNDLGTLIKVIRKTLLWKDFNAPSFRSMIRVYSGVQSVSNFRPTAAKCLYDTFLDENSVVWDMSCGFGGRLLGALSSKKIQTYIGTDPSPEAQEGLHRIKEDFAFLGKEVQLHQMGSEQFHPEKESLDFCFTSPPYFDKEMYSSNEDQSYLKFKSINSWRDFFLYNTLESCYLGLKPGKYCLINIANISNNKLLERDTVRIAKKIGFELEATWKLDLSQMMGKNHVKVGCKQEPIFVFRK